MIKVEHISSSEEGQEGSFPNETSDPKIVSRQADRLSKETTGMQWHPYWTLPKHVETGKNNDLGASFKLRDSVMFAQRSIAAGERSPLTLRRKEKMRKCNYEPA